MIWNFQMRTAEFRKICVKSDGSALFRGADLCESALIFNIIQPCHCVGHKSMQESTSVWTVTP